MHERALMRDVIARIEGVVRAESAVRATRISVQLGALSHLTPEHFREHFQDAAQGTVAEGAAVDATLATDIVDPQARDVVLTSVEVEA